MEEFTFIELFKNIKKQFYGLLACTVSPEQSHIRLQQCQVDVYHFYRGRAYNHNVTMREFGMSYRSSLSALGRAKGLLQTLHEVSLHICLAAR